MHGPDGRGFQNRITYEEVVSPLRIVYRHGGGGDIPSRTKPVASPRHPMSPTWPLELLTTVTFEDAPPGKTKLTLRWLPINASEGERKTFEAAHDGMRQGWGGSFDQLAAYLDRAGRER